MQQNWRTAILGLAALMGANLIGCGGDDGMNINYPEIKEPISFTVDQIGREQKLDAEGLVLFTRAIMRSGYADLSTGFVKSSPEGSVFSKWGVFASVPVGGWWPMGRQFMHLIDASGGRATFGRSEPIPGMTQISNIVGQLGTEFGLDIRDASGGDDWISIGGLTDSAVTVTLTNVTIPAPATPPAPATYKVGDAITTRQGNRWHVVQIRPAQGELPAFVELRPEPVSQPKAP